MCYIFTINILHCIDVVIVSKYAFLVLGLDTVHIAAIVTLLTHHVSRGLSAGRTKSTRSRIDPSSEKVQKIFLQIFDQTSFDLRAAAALLMMDQLTRNNKTLNFINER